MIKNNSPQYRQITGKIRELENEIKRTNKRISTLNGIINAKKKALVRRGKNKKKQYR